MFHLPFSKAKENVVAVADIDGASAAVAIMRAGSAGAPSIIVAAERSSLPIEKRTQERSAALLALALADASHKALAAYHAKAMRDPISALYCVARAPWMEVSMFEGKAEYEGDTRITQALIGELARDVLAKGRSGGAAASAETQVVSVELNGYPTIAPARKLARAIRIAILASDVDPGLREAAEYALGAAFPGRTVTWRSRSRSLLTLLRTSALDVRNCLVVDVGAAGTSLMVIRKGVIEAQAEVSEGTRSIVEQVAHGGMPEEVLSSVRALETDACNSEECKRMAAALAQVEQLLVRSFGEQLAGLAAQRRLPNALVLLAHEDLTPWLARFFGRIDFAQFTTTTLPFSVLAPQAPGLAASIQAAEGLAADASLKVACALVHSELH